MTTNPTTPTPTDGQLQPARQALNHAISQLIDPRPQTHDGRIEWLNPRYHELREALTAQRLGAKSKPQSQPPVWLAGLELLTRIDHTAHMHAPDTPIQDCDDYPTIQRLRYLDARKWRPQDTELVTTITNTLTTHTHDCDALFAPPPKFLPNKCPRCEHHKARRMMDDGKPGYIPALQVTVTGATCNNCKTHWPANELPFLGRLLGYRIQGVIE